jgi:hypothetical protein
MNEILGTVLFLGLSTVLIVILAKSMFQIIKVEPNTVYLSKNGNVKWIVLTRIEDMVTLASPDYSVRINISVKQLNTEFIKMETL